MERDEPTCRAFAIMIIKTERPDGRASTALCDRARAAGLLNDGIELRRAVMSRTNITSAKIIQSDDLFGHH
jgi:hypothetical protein